MTLRQLFEQYGITQSDLAQRLSIKRQYAYALWNGKRRLGANLAKRISDEFGISLEALLRAEVDRPAPRRRGRPRKPPQTAARMAGTVSL